MEKNSDPVYANTVVEFAAVANEYCKYAEHASELKGQEMLAILQRILPLLYLKASLLPSLEPVFEDGNEKIVTEADWNRIHDTIKNRLGSADDFASGMSDIVDEADIPVPVTMSENLADVYQDLKDFIILYQTGTTEVMNDAVWECRMNFENIWGEKLLNTLRAVHKFLYSGKEIEAVSPMDVQRDTDDWFISRRQKDLTEDDEQ
ncbi:MAG: DUF5063 domain-containing protein [Bacteroidales bacterium]|jgi:hypothetical protein|nr:DUF5063 domain-containing protein [Bacteroidales bacterium]